jgi:hypothetical protein
MGIDSNRGSSSGPARAADPEAALAGTARPPYEPPRLTPVGNLRDLLGKSGPTFDFATHRPEKP